MGIEVYLVPPGLRDAKYGIFKKALGGITADYSKVLYVSPTRHMLDGFRDEFHARIPDGRCYIPPRLNTLSEFAVDMASTFGGKTVLGRPLSTVLISALTGTGIGMANLISGFIRELKQHYPSGSPESIIKTLEGVLGELDIHDAVSTRIMGALSAFKAYDEALKCRCAIDADDALPVSAGLTDKLEVDFLFLDGFYEVTHAEELLIGGLIESAKNAVVSIPISDADDDLSYCYCRYLSEKFGVRPVMLSPAKIYRPLYYHPAPSMEDELEGIARHIKSSYLAGRLRDLEDVFIVFPNADPYREMTGRVLERYGIPCRMRPPAINKAALDILSLLESVSDGYPRLAFARVLSSPRFKNPDIETLRPIVPSICLSGVVNGKDAWLNAFRQNGAAFHKTGLRLFKKLAPLENIEMPDSYGAFIKVLRDTLDGLGFDPGDDGEMEKAISGIALIGDFGGLKTDIRGFIEAVRQVASGGGRTEGDVGVRVTELFEVRGLEPGFLYFAGLRDGDIPARPEIDFLMPEQVRRRLGLLDTDRYLSLQARIFGRLVSSSGGAELSYPAMEGDKFYLPSSFLSGIEESPGGASGIFSEEERQLRHLDSAPLTDYIAQVVGIRKYTGKSPLRVTDIDYYRTCPRRFFIEKLLNIEPIEIKDYEVEAKTIGTVIHAVMERIIGRFDDDYAIFKENIEPLIDEELLKDRPLDSYFKAVIRESILRILPEIHRIEHELRDNGHNFEKAELPVEGEPIKGIRLRGKIDRIDTTADGDIVIDYKTGGAYLSGSGVLKRGETLQLLLYASILKTMGLKPERVGIYSLKDLSVKWLPGKRDKKSIEDYIEAALKYLVETVKSMRKGDFKAIPLSEQTCRQCYERPYCPYIQKGKSG